jgi:hypothetical protein
MAEDIYTPNERRLLEAGFSGKPVTLSDVTPIFRSHIELEQSASGWY